MQYAFEWKKIENDWQCNHIWVKKYLLGPTNSQRILHLWQSKMIGELQLVFTVKDEDMAGKLGYTHISKYTEALVKFVQ